MRSYKEYKKPKNLHLRTVKKKLVLRHSFKGSISNPSFLISNYSS